MAAHFECWNPCCPWYAGYGQRLKLAQVSFTGDGWHCNTCNSPVTQKRTPDANENVLGGLAGGALIGGAFGGGAGALFGALIGLILGSSSTRGGQ
jgi:uncharacterized protein YcfJ